MSKLPAPIANKLHTFDLDKIEGLYAKLPSELRQEYCELLLWLNLPIEQRVAIAMILRAEADMLPAEASCAPLTPGPSPQERWEAMADEQHMSKLQDQLDAKWLMENADDDD